MAIRLMLMMELSDIVGPENVEDLSNYILSFQDANDIKATLRDIIGNESVANTISTEILKSRGQYEEEDKRLTAVRPKGTAEVDRNEQTKTKKANQSHMTSPAEIITPEAHAKEEKKIDSRSTETKKSKDDGKHTRPVRSDVIPKPKCHCLGTTHPILFNCSECGNIICSEEELEVCTFCGAFSRHYRKYTHGSEEEESLRVAIDSKNRLLQYDRDNAARSQVYDDQQDYFDLNDKWNGKTVSADAYKPVYVERSKQPIAISFDFAGRRVVMDERRVMEERRRVETQEVEEKPLNTSGYYVPPGDTDSVPIPTTSRSAQPQWEEHKYHNPTLSGKADLLYESLSKKLQHGLKLDDVKVVDGKKWKHVSKNWKREGEDFVL